MAQRKVKDRKADAKPWLEWIASSFGLLVALTLVGVLGWDALRQDGALPAVRVETGTITRHAHGYTVEIRTSNATLATAADVEIEGVLSRDGRAVETARARLDFVPGSSIRRGGLFFANDPRAYELKVRALGYAQP